MNTKTIKHAMALALFSTCSYILQAQLTLSGSVISPEKTPIPFSVIGIKNTFLSTQSNSLGQFEFKNLKAGTYILFTKCVGYKVKIDSVEIKDNLSFEIVLNQDDKSLDEVVVSSTRVDNNLGFAYADLSSEEIKKQNVGQDLPYALNSMASVVVNSDAGNGVGYTGLRIRGTDGTRINLTINGIPVNDAESQGTFFVNMADILSSANNIQVQRGAGTSANGAGAFGASINMQTNQLNEKAYGHLNNSFGSFNTTKNTIAAGTGLINNHFTLDARASRINSDGYIDRASSKLNSFYIAAGYYKKNTSVKAIMFSGWEKTYQAWNYVLKDSIDNGNRTDNSCGRYYDANGTVKYYNNETDNYKQDNYQVHFIHSFNNKLIVNLTGHYTAGKGYYEQFKQGQSLSDYKMPDVMTTNDTIRTTDLIRRLWLDNDFIGAIGNISYKPNTMLNFVLGGGYNTYFGRHNGEVIWAQFSNANDFKPRYYDDKATKKDGNVYLKTTIKPTNKFTAYVDLQYRTISYDFMGFDTSLTNKQPLNASYGFFNPKVGINYLVTKNTNVYASYSIANKEPNRNDFVQSSILSRPESEQLNDLEIGATHRLKNVSIGVNYYDMQYKNQLVLNGQINDVGAYNRVNVDYSYRRGVEVELNANITKYFTFNGNITLSQNKVNNYTEYIDSSNVDYSVFKQYKVKYTNTDISFSPNVVAASNFIFKPIKNLEISFLNKYVGKQYLDNTSDNERAIDSYLITDLRVNYTIKTKLIQEINLMAIVYNLSNTKYETNGYNYSYYIDDKLIKSNYLAPAAPTHFMLGVNLTF
ncbi:MAG: TonB-dependent receptor [Bacteroidia bacterium]|nr:TonB-dependent receptor [Bacteroidia bacterium]